VLQGPEAETLRREGSPILNTTITLSRLAKRGYEALLDHYRKVAPHLNEPLYTRPVRTVV
jgi:RNA-directed DNA polymerase